MSPPNIPKVSKNDRESKFVPGRLPGTTIDFPETQPTPRTRPLKKLAGSQENRDAWRITGQFFRHRRYIPNMARRSKSREVAVQMLYQMDLNPEVKLPTVRKMVAEAIEDPDLQDFAWRLFVGVMEVRQMLDEKIQSVAANWSLKRMAPTDRNVLRLGLFELLHTDTPHRVILDESIELARVFGSAQSPQFVNGILDKLVPAEKRSQPPRSDAK